MTEHTPFTAAADRLDGFLRDLKRAQCDAAGVKARPHAPPEPADAPDSAWRRRFAVRSVQSFPAGAPPLPELTAIAPERPAPPLSRVPQAPMIGTVLGKPAQKRGRFWGVFGSRKR